MVKIQRVQDGNKSLGMLKIVQFRREIFTLSPVVYITIDFKKLVSELFHAGFRCGIKQMYQEKNEVIRIAPNITIASKPLHLQYESTMQCISLTLHCKYPAKSL